MIMTSKQHPGFEMETSLSSTYKLIAGLDEAGRGPLAGPVVAAAVILPNIDYSEFGINDSKKLSAKQRESLFVTIKKIAIDYGIGIVGPERIDEINILNATMEAFQSAIENMRHTPDYLLIDGNYYSGSEIPYSTVVKGDAKVLSIAAASILAKVTRDKYMTDVVDKLYPEYEFAKHKGYPTKKHFENIKKNGISMVHRKTFLIKFAYRENLNFWKKTSKI